MYDKPSVMRGASELTSCYQHIHLTIDPLDLLCPITVPGLLILPVDCEDCGTKGRTEAEEAKQDQGGPDHGGGHWRRNRARRQATQQGESHVGGVNSANPSGL